MDKEQTILFVKLTKLQQHVAIAKLHGENIRKAYRVGGGKAKTDNATDNAICIMLKNAKVNDFIVFMSEEAVERALCTTEDVVKGLLKEATIGKEKADETTPASRVSALKALSDYTGGFDNNVNKIKAQIVEKSFNDFYDE